jgi:L-iditol 2-dehydrogenase
MKAVNIPKPLYAELVEVEDASAGPNEVVVKVNATGICGSDLAAYLGKHSFRVPPVITGHELAGTVTQKGEGVRDIEVGDRVAIEPLYGCGECDFCKSGNYNLCRQRQVLGASYWTGSFAEYVVLPPKCLYKVPPGVSMAVASLIEPFCVGLHSVEKAHMETGQNVAILGSGTIGLMTLLGALQYKPNLLICSDLRKFNLDMALSLGATHAINPKQCDLAEEINKVTKDKGVDTCLLAAPSPDVIEQAIGITRPGGRIVVISLFEETPTMNFREFQTREQEIVGTSMYTRSDYLKAIELFPDLKGSMSNMITHRISMEQLPEMLENLIKGKVKNVIKVIVEMATRLIEP